MGRAEELNEQQADKAPPETMPYNNKNDIRALRRPLGWIATEIRETGKGGNMRRRRAIRRGDWQKDGEAGGAWDETNRLKEMQAKARVLLRIGMRKKRKTERSLRRAKAVRWYVEKGTRSLQREAERRRGTSRAEIEGVRRFWDDIWGVSRDFNPSNRVLSAWKREKRRQMGRGRSRRSGEMQSWKAPGPDGIPGYWYRALPSVANALKIQLVDILDQKSEVPAWFMRGRTILIPKTGCTGEPSQYRPITCLNIAYKLLTGMMAQALSKHLETWDLLPLEQKAIKKGNRGCLDTLIVDGAAAEEARKWKGSLSVAWIEDVLGPYEPRTRYKKPCRLSSLCGPPSSTSKPKEDW